MAWLPEEAPLNRSLSAPGAAQESVEWRSLGSVAVPSLGCVEEEDPAEVEAECEASPTALGLLNEIESGGEWDNVFTQVAGLQQIIDMLKARLRVTV